MELPSALRAATARTESSSCTPLNGMNPAHCSCAAWASGFTVGRSALPVMTSPRTVFVLRLA